jgi:hypothetical protein
MKVLRIRDRTSAGILAVDLGDILRVVGHRGAQLRWSVHDLEATGDVATVWPAGMLDLEAMTARADGLTLGWDEVCRLAASISQTINCSVLGRRENGPTEVRIRAFDSTDWTVDAVDEELIHELQRTFRDTEEVLGAQP